MGAPVMIWDHPAQEHYYAALEDGVTHPRRVQRDHRRGVAEHLIRHKRGFTKRLREGAARVQRELTCAQCLNRYFLATLAELRQRFRGDLALGTREARAGDARGVNCSGHDLVSTCLCGNQPTTGRGPSLASTPSRRGHRSDVASGRGIDCADAATDVGRPKFDFHTGACPTTG